MRARLTIGSRGSRLALWQAEHVAALLRGARPGLDVAIEIIATTGDKILDAPLAKIGGKGLFTKEIEDALLDRRVDLAVHSLKDLPTTLPEGLRLGAVLSRHDPSDALVCPAGLRFADLPVGARLGTSSLRRRAQLLHARPDLRIGDLRGNVPTRVARVRAGDYDAIVLARSGLERLGLSGEVTEVLSADLLLPAPGQGALGIEIRDGDGDLSALLGGLEDPAARAATRAERGFLRALGGGCQVPVGALARPGADGGLRLEGMVADPSGEPLLRGERSGSIGAAEALGEALAADLIARGAAEILARLDPEARQRGEGA